GWCKEQEYIPINQTSFQKIIKQENISISGHEKTSTTCVLVLKKSVSTEDYQKHVKMEEMAREEKRKMWDQL
ncbi:hypothetical protein HHI36_007900, partial [Cryptolaemus montrouzieri]